MASSTLRYWLKAPNHICHNQPRLAGGSGIDKDDVPNIDIVANLRALLHDLADSLVSKLLSGKDPRRFAAMEPGPSVTAADTGAQILDQNVLCADLWDRPFPHGHIFDTVVDCAFHGSLHTVSPPVWSIAIRGLTVSIITDKIRFGMIVSFKNYYTMLAYDFKASKEGWYKGEKTSPKGTKAQKSTMGR